MTKFYFEIKGWHELDEESYEKYAKYTDEEKREHFERAKRALHALMLEEVLDLTDRYDLDVKYIEMEGK